MDCFRIPEWELMEEYRMEITDVRVRKIAKEGKMKAIVSITFDDEFVVHDIKAIEGEKGLFIAETPPLSRRSAIRRCWPQWTEPAPWTKRRRRSSSAPGSTPNAS